MNEATENFVIYLPVLAGLFFLSLFIWVILSRRKTDKRKEEKEEDSKPLELPQKESIELPDFSQKKEKVPVATPRPVDVLEAPAPQKKRSFAKAISSWLPLLQSKSKDREAWEEVLIRSDMGPKLADELLEGLEKTESEPAQFFRSQLKAVLLPAKSSQEPWTEKKPWVVFIVGVNGVGKTTSIVKLAQYFTKQERSVGVVGADTFRKAAIEQLERGCLKAGGEFFSIRPKEEQSEGADPSAVIFDGLRKFADKDVILVDTSGRLHTKKNLMEELKKMKRVAEKSMPGAPHDIWLVLDSTLGQNALSQAKVFDESVQLTGLVLTKLDGLSRGGSVFNLFRELQKPIWFVGKGELLEDIERFDPESFVEDLFDVEAS